MEERKSFNETLDLQRSQIHEEEEFYLDGLSPDFNKSKTVVLSDKHETWFQLKFE